MAFSMDLKLYLSKEILIERGLTDRVHQTSPGERYFNGFLNWSGRSIFPRESLSKTYRAHQTSPGEEYFNGFLNESGSFMFPRKSLSKEDSHTAAIELVQASYISMVFYLIWKLNISKEIRIERRRTHRGHWTRPGELYFNGFLNCPGNYIRQGNPYRKSTYTQRPSN